MSLDFALVPAKEPISLRSTSPQRQREAHLSPPTPSSVGRGLSMGDEGEPPATPFTPEQCTWLQEKFGAGPSRVAADDESAAGSRTQSSEQLAPHSSASTGESRVALLAEVCTIVPCM